MSFSSDARWRPPLLGLLAVACWAAVGGLGGCKDATVDGGVGATCVRTSQCADALACVDGECTADLGPLGEAGTPRTSDAGDADMLADADDGTDAATDAEDLDAGVSDAGAE